MLSTHGAISAFQVAHFGLIVLPFVYILLKHGKHGLLGWFFIIAFCTLRVVGGAMNIQAELNHTFSEPGAIIANIGLSPLCFALTGIAHEASQSVIHRSKFVLGWPQQAITHVLVATGLPLVIVGALNAGTPGESPDKVQQNVNLIRAGAGLFLVVFLLISIQVIVSIRQPRTSSLEKILIVVIALCLPELLLRILYMFIGAILNSATWGPLTGGTLVEQLVLEVVPECLITIVLVVGGTRTRNLAIERLEEERPRAAEPERRRRRRHRRQEV